MNPREEKIEETLTAAKAAFYDSAQQHTMNYFEFLFVQTTYIQKRWWLYQAVILGILWQLLSFSGSDLYLRRSMGVFAPLFAVMMLPELWKNRSSASLEIENASYYSLRQIYAARMQVFALVDFLLLSLFISAAAHTAQITLWEILIQFLLPMIITCCIIFRTLFSRHITSGHMTLVLCMLAALLWLQIVSNKTLYDTVTLPAWITSVILSVCYLAYCIFRSIRQPAANYEIM